MDLATVVVILEVAVGLGLVIFVHELGHFVVAKLCGVKCEKFYLGFDIYGLKLLHFRWGETEYGIGILPLGGYVKMLGQDDNPARAAQERERSHGRRQAGRASGEADGHARRTAAVQPESKLDPRSYMAKSVPQRMAIISAGVIMNVIFAFLMAVVRLPMGVKDVACGVSAVEPGEAAWRADLQPGDQFVAIDIRGDRPLRFRDLMPAVALCDLKTRHRLRRQARGPGRAVLVNVKPDVDRSRLRPTIGVAHAA